MAVQLPQDVQDLLKLMSPEDATAFTKVVEAQPKLAEGWLRQSDYDRNSNKWKSDVAAANAERDRWVEWGNKSKPKHDSLLEDYDRIQAENEELKAKVTTAVAAGGGTVQDATAIQAAVQQRLDEFKGQFISRKDVDTMIEQETVKRVTPILEAERQKFFETTWPQTILFQSQMVESQLNHRVEFNEPLDVKALSDYMREQNISDLGKGYKDFVGPKRQEREIKRQVEEGIKQFKSTQNVPGVSGSSVSQELGPLQIRIAERDPLSLANPANKNVGVGDGVLANMAAAELRAEGKV